MSGRQTVGKASSYLVKFALSNWICNCICDLSRTKAVNVIGFNFEIILHL